MLLFRSHPTQYLVLIRSDFRRGGRSAAEVGAAWFSQRKRQKGDGKVPTRTSLRTTAGNPPGTRGAAACLGITNSFQKFFPVWACFLEQTEPFWEAPNVF